MPRWIQKINPETGESEFVPADEAAARADGLAIHGDIEQFVSPLDGSVIRDRKQLREHMKKHGVVHASEFDGHYEKCAEERRKHYQNDHDRHVVRERRMQINEIINHLQERAR